jgi:hypothetical protein
MQTVRCFEESGYHNDYRKTSTGLYIELPRNIEEDEERYEAVYEVCMKDFLVIDSVYRIQQANPELLKDSRLVAVKCLTRAGYLSADYTVEDFEEDWNSEGFPFDPGEEAANDCLYGAGYAYFSLEEPI